jgi:hypothetical protein
MASRNDDHLSDIISLVQGSPRKKAEPMSTAVQKKVKATSKKGRKKAGRKPLSAQNRRSEILIIRLTRAEKGKLRKLARDRHSTLSSFVRKTSIGEEEENVK